MMIKLVSTSLAVIYLSLASFAQDTLPNFSVKNAGNNRVIISWVNNYQKAKQISIQRSADSTKNFRTILSVPDPMNKQNGFVDSKAPAPNMFYRLFIMLDGAMYVFSPSKRPFTDTMSATAAKKLLDPFAIDINKPVKNIDSLINADKNSKNKANIFVPSMYVYTARDGNVHLNLPDAELKRYSVKFYDDKNNFLFEVKHLKESSLIVDKSNFYHAGWFKFELFLDEDLKESHRFYLQKDF